MAELVGIENLTKIAKDGAHCATAICNKSGVFAIVGSLLDLSTINWTAVATEAKDLSEDERKTLEKVLSDEFQPSDKKIDLGFDKLIALGEKSAALVQRAVAEGHEVYETVKDLIGEWKSFLGVA